MQTVFQQHFWLWGSGNTAQRIQSVSKPGQILLIESSYYKIKESFKCKYIGQEVSKNKAGKTVLYEVID